MKLPDMQNNPPNWFTIPLAVAFLPALIGGIAFLLSLAMCSPPEWMKQSWMAAVPFGAVFYAGFIFAAFQGVYRWLNRLMSP